MQETTHCGFGVNQTAHALISQCPDPAMDQVKLRISQSAKVPTILINGATGVGKKSVARAIHELGVRGKFISTTCAAFNRELLASELFGTESGLFIKQQKKYVGFAEEADRGTLFLDEIGELALDAQAKLIGLLHTGSFRRIGGDTNVPSRFKFVAATNQDLLPLVNAGKLRRDLFSELNAFPISIPPLRERRDDIIHLARLFIASFSGGKATLDPLAETFLQSYWWPGNVSELRNSIEEASVVARGETTILPSHIRFGGIVSSEFHKTQEFAGLVDQILPYLGASGIEGLQNLIIEEMVRRRTPVAEIARLIDVNESTIYREIKRQRTVKKN